MRISSFPFAIRDFDHWKHYRDSSLYKNITSEYEKQTGHDVQVLLTMVRVMSHPTSQ